MQQRHYNSHIHNRSGHGFPSIYNRTLLEVNFWAYWAIFLMVPGESIPGHVSLHRYLHCDDCNFYTDDIPNLWRRSSFYKMCRPHLRILHHYFSGSTFELTGRYRLLRPCSLLYAPMDPPQSDAESETVSCYWHGPKTQWFQTGFFDANDPYNAL